MKLYALKIPNYKILKGFYITFSQDHATSVVIGKNGSGKTTIIECLTEIFSKLFRCSSLDDIYNCEFPFVFEITYLLRKEENVETTSLFEGSLVNYIAVKVDNFDENTNITLYYADQEFHTNGEISKFLRSNGQNVDYLLPDNLVLYYSGISDTLRKNFKAFQEEIILGSLDGEAKVDQPFFYFLPENFPAILTGLLGFQYGDVPDILSNKFSLAGFNKISIFIQKPKWAKPNTDSSNFWGAKGELYIFLTRLHAAANDFVLLSTSEVQYNITDMSQLVQLWEYYGTERRLFEYFVSLQANGLIGRIEITLNKAGVEVPFQRLSEGEMQLLTIIGLKELLAENNSLFLLDEPDTYLHPEWKVQFFDNLFFGMKTDLGIDEEYPGTNDHYFVTTHSPALISNLRAGDVFSIEKGRAKKYSGQTFGKDLNAIAKETMETFERTPLIAKELELIHELINNNDLLNAKEKIQKLFDLLGEQPFLIRLNSIIKRKEIIGR